MRGREAGTEIMMRLPEPSLELVKVSIEANQIFIFLFYSTRQPKNLKTSGAWTKKYGRML
jgi:hypothetical protein